MNHQGRGEGKGCAEEFDKAKALVKKKPGSEAGSDGEKELH
jgi:hypothetical protein